MQFETIWVFILISSTACLSGWYECYNYEGSISKYPIILSLQIMDRAFSKVDSYKICGNYRYKSKNDPILLDGKFDTKSGNMIIFEYQTKLINGNFYNNLNTPHDSTAVFSFKFDTSSLKGTWTNIKSGQNLPLSLKLISQFKDFNSNGTDSTVAIPQSFSAIDRYFVGEYSYNPTEDYRGKMVALKIFNKKNNCSFQVIDFTEYSTNMGNVSTPVHNNVSVTKNGFWIWADLGKMGTEIYYTFNIEEQKYEITKEGKDLLRSSFKTKCISC